ncbi:MAG: NAD(+) diphosphatase [Spirochaetaceae bacterium]
MIFKENTILVNSSDHSLMASDIAEEGQEYVHVRALIPILSSEEMQNVLLEFQNFSWQRRTTFCGVCGTKSILDDSEGCNTCPNCSEKFFPAQFPAVIVAIIKGDEILLAHNVNFPGDMTSIIAGFVDLGENAEEAIKREVMEEVGLKVKNIKYHSSQNWGFTSSLMLGYTAEYESGEIKIDEVEIDKAGWFNRNSMPETLPPKISIARAIIDDFIKG